MSRQGAAGNGKSVKATAAAEETAADLGKTIQRLRKAYNLSLGELSEQSGVAKSIISQIERNETNPTLSTVVKLSRALDTTVDEVLRGETQSMFLEHQQKSAVPILESQDGLCRLAIAGPLSLVDHFQWYDFHAKAKGVLESSPHPAGTVEHLYVVDGELEVTTGGETKFVKSGEALRYRADVPHRIVNVGAGPAHAVMMLALRQFGVSS
ncbi:MAG: helix-turn-helix domain-containing protein [Phyllobacteriaceae bacterium]|jgi:transcriptional regulator with XRE-family HTH domain|nr:helix-turn-helix domain-containing protein [Phyllobacteriaceae bacterium]